MNKKKIIEIILLILIIASTIVSLIYLSIDNTLSVSYDKVSKGFRDPLENNEYYEYLLETYEFLKANFITCIVSLVFFTVLLIVKLSGIKVDKILNFILTIIIILFLMLFTGLAFGFLFYFVQEEFFFNIDTGYNTVNYKFINLESVLIGLKREIKNIRDEINIWPLEADEIEIKIKSLEEQADKLEYLINLYYILIYSGFFTALFLALLILTKLY